MPLTPVTCPLDCPDACGALVEADDDGRFVALKGNPAHGYSRGTLCGKTAFYGDLITSPERLLQPLVREGSKSTGRLLPATWGEALERIAERVRPLLDAGRGESILGASYAGSMGQVARKFPLRMLHAMGGTLTDDGLCDNSATAGFEVVMGHVIGPDIEQAGDSDLLVLWGCDMRRTHQHFQPIVRQLAKAGVPLVVIDIYRTDTVRDIERLGGETLLVEPGTDALLALAIARLAYERGWADREALEREAHGHEEFERHVRSAHGLDEAVRVTGVPREAIERLGEQLARARRPFLKTGVGFARRRNGAMSMRAVCSLGAVFGHARRVHYESSSTFGLSTEVIDRPDLRPGGGAAPLIHHVQLGRELESDRFGAVFVWGHNPAVTCPDEGRVRAGLAREDLFVVVHEQFLTETARLADVVLPATMFPEHADVYRSYNHRRLHYSLRATTPPAGPRCNVDAFGSIAHVLGLPQETWDATAEGLCEELLAASIERFGPEGLERLRTGEPLKIEPPEGWGTPSGKIELVRSTPGPDGSPPLASWIPDDGCGDPGAFWLTCAPSIHTHNSTFLHSARHLKRMGPPTVHASPADVERLVLEPGERVTLFNPRGAVSLTLAEDAGLPPGMLRVDGVIRADETPEGCGINVLVAPQISDLGDSNILYSTRVDLRRFEGA